MKQAALDWATVRAVQEAGLEVELRAIGPFALGVRAKDPRAWVPIRAEADGSFTVVLQCVEVKTNTVNEALDAAVKLLKATLSGLPAKE